MEPFEIVEELGNFEVHQEIKEVANTDPNVVAEKAEVGLGAPRKDYTAQDEKFFKAIGMGLSVTSALEYAGLNHKRVYQRATRDPEFVQKMLMARGEAKMINLAYIRRAAKGGDWRAAAEWLKLCFPDEFGPKRIEVDPAENQDKPLKIEITFSDGTWNPDRGTV